MLLRELIYMGEVNGETIYFDVKKKIPMKSPNSQYIDSKKTKKNNWWSSIILISLFIIISSISFFTKTSFLSGRYTYVTLTLIVIMWIFEVFLLTKLINNTLYKNVRSAVPATKKELGYAIKENNIWNIFNNKKVTIWKKLTAWLLTIVVVVCTVAIIPVAYFVNQNRELIGHQIGSEIIVISLMGILPFSSILLVWDNNLIRWLNVVEKYQKRV
ncbi:hypothetical protein JZO73_00805 [Enterococcus plantarum]|uniref:hypothetical protein n=1 Tax=Enterococcus plantarum TaxID=1077675 RepID=UPI001A8EF675|nr:hypothetical protein [Enterococcus plantarum]MBO0466069.1 hypothetical protein [Enterococcus plantarum]